MEYCSVTIKIKLQKKSTFLYTLKSRVQENHTDWQTSVTEIVITSNTNWTHSASKKVFFFSVIISHSQFLQ